MPRRRLYPEGWKQLNTIVPVPVKDGIERLATDQRQSMSQIVTVILEDHLRRRGYLREREPEVVTA